MGDKEMTKREKFIEFVEHMMTQMNFSASELEEHKEAIDFFASLKATTAEQEKPLFTEKGKIIFQFMKDNKETYNNTIGLFNILSNLPLLFFPNLLILYINLLIGVTINLSNILYIIFNNAIIGFNILFIYFILLICIIEYFCFWF